MNTYLLRRPLGRRVFATALVVAVYASIEAPLRHFTSVELARLPAAQLRDDATAYAASALHAEWLQIGQSAMVTAFGLLVLLIWAPVLRTALAGLLREAQLDRA